MKEFLEFGFLQFFYYLILVGNLRAIAKLHYATAAFTDAAHLVFLWFIIKRVADSHSPWAFAGYVVGGTLGTLVSMYLTRRWKDDGDVQGGQANQVATKGANSVGTESTD